MRKNLMVVERDSDILYVITRILEEEGYKVVPFMSESGVLERIIKDKPDAIILDVMRPTEESTVLCREIKAIDDIKEIPIIALSTHVEAHKIKSLCADKVVGKPFDITELIDAVESQLQA
jgi:DNA-binding response OmpR family regulator